MATRKEIEAGAELFTSGRHTCIYQHGDEDVFVTDGTDSIPAPGWHLAIVWCDVR